MKHYYGFPEANASGDPAWFHTAAAAKRFAVACGWDVTDCETSDDIDCASLMDSEDKPWGLEN